MGQSCSIGKNFMQETPIKLNIVKTVIVKGNYEGHDYYKIIAETSKGLTLSRKLTAFEYQTLLQEASKA